MRTDSTLPTRFGFIISKRVGVAVVRNRLRRRLKGISLEVLSERPVGLDIVYRLNPEATDLSYDELRTSARAAISGAVRKADRAALSSAHRA